MAPYNTSLPPKILKSWQNSGIETTPSVDDNVDTSMAPNDIGLPPKVRKSWQRPGIGTAPSEDDNMDPTGSEYPWCPEVVEIMAKYGLPYRQKRVRPSLLDSSRTTNCSAVLLPEHRASMWLAAHDHVLQPCAALTFLDNPRSRRLLWRAAVEMGRV